MMTTQPLKYDPRVVDPMPFLSEDVTGLAPANAVTEIEENPADEIRGINDFDEQQKEYEPRVPGAKPFTFFYRNNDAYQYHQLNGWESYPKNTNVHCWWDSHSFQTQPIGLPIKREDKSNTYHCIGCFCSANCALAYAMNSKISPVLLNQLYNEMNQPDNVLDQVDESEASKLYDELNNESKQCIEELTSAPHFSTLAIFGGTFDINEFRNKCKSQWKNYTAPMVPWAVISEERVRNNIVKPKPVSSSNKEKLSKLRSISRT